MCRPATGGFPASNGVDRVVLNRAVSRNQEYLERDDYAQVMSGSGATMFNKQYLVIFPMAMDPSDMDVSAIDRWDQLHHALASQERRMILYSLMRAPEERRLPLPDAAMAPQTGLAPEKLRIHLRHNHLPVLADAGYVRWEREPFCVQRGPYFEEVETIFDLIHESIDQFPISLVEGCEIYEELYQNAPE